MFARAPETVLALAEQLCSGVIDDVAVQCGRLEDLAIQGQWVDLPAASMDSMATNGEEDTSTNLANLLQESTDLGDLTAAQEQELDDISPEELCERLWSSASLREQAEVLELLQRRLGSSALLTGPDNTEVELRTLVGEIYRRGLQQQDWNVVRRCAGVLAMVHPQLEDALIDLLARQKSVVVGRNYSADSILNRPLGSGTIAALMRRTCGVDARESSLQQELLLALDGLARRQPKLLRGTLTLQLGQLLLLLTSELATERCCSQDEGFEALCSEPPHAIGLRLRGYSPTWSTLAPPCNAMNSCICEARCNGPSQNLWSSNPVVATGCSTGSGWDHCNGSRKTFTRASGHCSTIAAAW